ncbi:hypothetical protein L4X63_12305 [Geomonas sp. Red32]|uniref:hypothetical protein n=1 Tax=Geomonas sp. Red32 TaxID=2912856 RepID=UPI00202CB255|nr:hypothetical protein [Geomonas sp. Red32]MCM0082371.1 hypothetical protein [Geomonas sp. Red32]
MRFDIWWGFRGLIPIIEGHIKKPGFRKLNQVEAAFVLRDGAGIAEGAHLKSSFVRPKSASIEARRPMGSAPLMTKFRTKMSACQAGYMVKERRLGRA